MESIKRSALVPFSAEQMFSLVDDIERYPEFVPHCKGATIISRSENKVCARLDVAKSGIAKSFATENILVPFSHIEMKLLDGPFRHLSGRWIFTPLSENACKIELDLQFEFSNKLASMAFSGIFNQLIQSMVAAFTTRAEEVFNV
ncbi:type II toxin-antitoxin system RatA family toxin [Aliikangiella sp. G2MR2-5]|uniref:type II toxin-antitoxin system RatA family toxin n=1 Tax=Aliikangiella sp. G2MR2-5 TaxID=2788943 RepID=UPI0018A9490E|nr:type II toxin-antitoxin system RatA family toxin [Aliikangiella sp. G2MR2-5]